MTIAAPTSVNWIRLMIGDGEFTIEPSPGIDLHLAVQSVEYDGYLDPLTLGPRPELRLSVHLVPRDTDAVVRCEAQAREVAERLGAYRSALAAVPMFSLEAALGGESLPYNRVAVPRLILMPGPEPLLDEDLPTPSVHVFTAKAHPVDGHTYTMRLVD
ncbi:hypothetical protein [Streptomyces alfalfae]|uniref:hypothetical protein n=1 Tax=Streptomyces alfalfae TaxID=1642299 RepID=UPI00281279F8|nr:hypothetical protein [Streptomyces alfalfae]